MPCMVKKGLRATTNGPNVFVNARGQVKTNSIKILSKLVSSFFLDSPLDSANVIEPVSHKKMYWIF